MAEKNLIKIYVNATSAKRVDIIIRHYTDFMGIVDGYTEGLRYMINCDFSGDMMDGVDRADEYMRDAYLLRDMRKDYELFRRQLCILGTEKETFEKYLCGEKNLVDIAEEQGITYESAQQKIHKIRSRVKKQVIGFMDGRMGGIA